MEECVPEETQNKTNHEIKNPEGIKKNHDISIDYVNIRGLQNRNKMKNIDKIFSYSVACDIINGSEDSEPRSVTACQNRHDWTK